MNDEKAFVVFIVHTYTLKLTSFLYVMTWFYFHVIVQSMNEFACSLEHTISSQAEIEQRLLVQYQPFEEEKNKIRKNLY